MSDQEKREKVIEGIERCLPMTTRNGLANCKQCPYDRKITLEGGIVECCHDLMADALALLKAQEPVEPEPKEVIYDDEHRSVYCPNCDNRLAGLTYSGAVALETEETPNYCWMCGQAVKWG